MPSKKRAKIEFNESSLNTLLQEIYDDTYNIRAKIQRLFTKWELKIKDSGEIAAIGEQIIKLINAESKNQDQKIMLLKYLKEVVFKDTNVKKDDEENKDITPTDRSALMKMVKDATIGM